MRSVFAKALMVWAAIIPLAVLNGYVRQEVLVPRLGPVAGLAVSGAILCVVIAAAAFAAAPWYGARARGHGVAIGAFWLVLTLAFEIGMALGAQDRTWSDVAQALNPATGNLRLFVLGTTLVAPIVAGRKRVP